MEEAAYHEVARLDHNVAPNRGHDIREEGIHMDLPENRPRAKGVGLSTVSITAGSTILSRVLEEEHRAYYLGRFEPIVGVPVQNSYYR